MRGRALLVLLLLAAALAPATAPAPAAAVPVPNPCDLPVVSQGCEAVGDAARDAAGAAAGFAGDAVLGALAGWAADGAAWMLEQVAAAIGATTRVDLGARWFEEHYAFMAGVGAILLLPLLLLTVLQALLRQDLALLARSPLLYLPAATLSTGLAVGVTQTALAVTDALSAELTSGIAEDTGSLAAALTGAGALAGVPLFAAFVLSLFMAVAAAFVWFELVLRAAAVYIAVMFLPLFLAAMIWPATAGWIRRLVQLIVAAVLSKLVIVATLSLGLAALGSGEDASSVFAGAGMFLLAAFSPFVLFSLIPLVADVAQPQREGRHTLAGATGVALAWNVARTRLAFGAGSPGRAGAVGTAGRGGAPGPGGPAGPALPLQPGPGSPPAGPGGAARGGGAGGAPGQRPPAPAGAPPERRPPGLRAVPRPVPPPLPGPAPHAVRPPRRPGPRQAPPTPGRPDAA